MGSWLGRVGAVVGVRIGVNGAGWAAGGEVCCLARRRRALHQNFWMREVGVVMVGGFNTVGGDCGFWG